MRKAMIAILCASGFMSLTAASAPPAPQYSAAALTAARALVAQSIGFCTGPEYGARVQQCIQTRCTGGGSVAECASSCQAQVRAQCGA